MASRSGVFLNEVKDLLLGFVSTRKKADASSRAPQNDPSFPASELETRYEGLSTKWFKWIDVCGPIHSSVSHDPTLPARRS